MSRLLDRGASGACVYGGIVSFVLGAFALYTGVEPGVESVQVSVHPILIVAAIALSLVYFWVLVRAALQMRHRGPAIAPMSALVGALGTAQTLIAPRGIAYAGGESWSARSRNAQIPEGSPVRIVEVDGLELIVEPTTEEAPSHDV